VILIKIGGGAAINLEGIVADLAGLDAEMIIVHGANALRDTLAERLGAEKRVVTSLSGYASVFSDEQAIDLLMLAYAGLRNKRIVELCQQHGLNAVGLSGLDGRVIQGKRNSGIKIEAAGKKKIIRDFSGKPQAVNSDLLRLLLQNRYVPVLCVPIIDENGFAINSENDDIINVLQREFRADKILQFIEAPGFLNNVHDPDSVVPAMSLEVLRECEAEADGRIKRKLHALVKLFEGGDTTVILADGRTAHPVNDALSGKGTVIT